MIMWELTKPLVAISSVGLLIQRGWRFMHVHQLFKLEINTQKLHLELDNLGMVNMLNRSDKNPCEIGVVFATHLLHHTAHSATVHVAQHKQARESLSLGRQRQNDWCTMQGELGHDVPAKGSWWPLHT